MNRFIRYILGISFLYLAGTFSQSLSAQALPHPHWQVAQWSDLPAWGADDWFDAWNAWLRSCEAKRQPLPTLVPLCRDVRLLMIASREEQQSWIEKNFVPYRVLPSPAAQAGLLTGYFEPELQASRHKTPEHTVALYSPPSDMLRHSGFGASDANKPWFSRQQIDTDAKAIAALSQRAIAFVADPMDALLAQIQGSVRLRIIDDPNPDGPPQIIRLGYATSNNHAYKSVGKWLMDQGITQDVSWPGIKAWAAANPTRLQELLWQNPRVVFFKEVDAQSKPIGAQGVPLTDGRSIAVDPRSIPFGLPVWLVTSGTTLNAARLVMAQDTGAAIQGPVRADLFVGTGESAASVAGTLKQSLQLWVLLPKNP